ncbi:ATP synthase F1 subunit epsilon [Caminibacter pacificus]|jgi:F-type H+-transporting ATPase subunit epsilon|uniref:ATP synthase epsilon chain n=1 Tax=Caminibacter pacificus TaxID=1424653 RepID=A0AAJ4RCU0_9BACT|nr:ATP synthase F1 subunit epsilon [Caminibacter pacificus]NPA87562.1 F0F1 ATP synthase subunit epsilon [Campylobacterota bacterium]QCI27899.1 F0F1 ATP synthase subunit epsilon [Caminibacter pacificus]ROR39923.1 ATP synthase F1 subcomplex epsilon subunit [Caminibacter pacificus]
MKIDIVTPLGRIYTGEIKEATFPGIEGEFGVLEGHAPLVTTLNPGLITIKKENGKEEVIAINWGYVEVTPDHINVLVDGAVPVSGASESEIAKSIEKAKQLLKDAMDSDALVATVEAKIESAARNI